MAPRPAKPARRAPSRTREQADRRAAPSGNDRRLQAHGHALTRQAHAGEVAEDYVEAIADLIDGVGEARVVDLAECLGVTHVTVVRTVARLQRDGLVSTKPYRAIFLTDSGRALAAKVRRRHETVLAFLRALGVSDTAARADTEGIEHHVSDETLAALERFLADSGPTSRTGQLKPPPRPAGRKPPKNKPRTRG